VALMVLLPVTGAAAKKKQAQAILVPPIDLNRASPKDLRTLPGIGSATARRIIAGRPYSSVKDLARVGVPAKTITAIASSVTASADDRFFNTAGALGMVWVNLDTKHYHKETSRWFGKTKNGKYMTESDAQRAGYKASRE
jgi:hypothetical protein